MKTQEMELKAQTEQLNIAGVSGRFSVKISEIIALRERMKEINSNDLNNIDFVSDNGEIVKIDDKIIYEFKYTGLNNIDFLVTYFYKSGL